MGNAKSAMVEDTTENLWWNPIDNPPENPSIEPTVSLSHSERYQRKKQMQEELHDFKKELHVKHEKGRQIIAQRKQEMADLREEVEQQKKTNEELLQRLSATGNEEIQRLKEENTYLKTAQENTEEQLRNVNAEVLSFECERQEYKTHVVALKDVITVSKEMLNIRETQIEELKQKVSIIENTLADKEMPILADDLRREYERQLRNIRNLRSLYEERERVDRREKQSMTALVEEAKKNLEIEQGKNTELQSRIEELEKENSDKYDTINSVESQLGFSKAEYKELQAEMAVINQLFSQILIGFNSSQDMDLDKLIKILEENHDLLSKIAINEESTSISAALPKTLLDLVNQMNEQKVEKSEEETECKLETILEESESPTSSLQLSSAEEIVQNLPKVWRVLIELLSHQCVPFNIIPDGTNKANEHYCYKSVQTPTGPKLVLSVSKTFIRLKDLILEKKSLQKETNRLKHLNTHLETRLQGQEKRLEMVSKELSKTWHVVGNMQKQHQLLHTQEKILRYELAQKRKMLNELKEELEYCREKWVQAREKNTITEIQWKQLRNEFASRKPLVDANAESGYSDDKSSSEDEPGYETDAECKNKKSPVQQNAKEVATRQSEEENENNILDVVKQEIENIEGDLNAATAKMNEENVDNSTLLVNINQTPSSSSVNIEEMLARREERLTRMEAQGKELVIKMTNTSKRGVDICNKLGNLHEVYGDVSNIASTIVEDNISFGQTLSDSTSEQCEANVNDSSIEKTTDVVDEINSEAMSDSSTTQSSISETRLENSSSDTLADCFTIQNIPSCEAEAEQISEVNSDSSTTQSSLISETMTDISSTGTIDSISGDTSDNKSSKVQEERNQV